MALIERLMHWGDSLGEEVGAEPDDRHIAVHQFFAAAYEVANGPRTVAQIKALYSMTPADEADFDALVAQVPSNTALKALFIEQLHAVLILAEDRIPNYATPAELRARLGI